MANWQKKKVQIFTNGNFMWGGTSFTEGSATITAYQYASNKSGVGARVVTEISGWDDSSGSVQFITEKLALSSGVALIRIDRVEREFSIQWDIKFSAPGDVFNVEEALRRAALVGTQYKVVRTYDNSDGSGKKEMLQQCLVRNTEMIRHNDLEGSFKVTFVALKPDMKVMKTTNNWTSMTEASDII